MSSHHDRIEPELVEEAEHVLRVILHAIALVRLVALAAAPQIEGEDVGDIRETRRHEPVEGVRVRRQTGREHERRPRPRMVEVMQPNPVGLDVAIAHARSPFCCRYVSLISRRSVFPATLRGNASSTRTSASF